MASDQKLLKLAAQGDQAAFAELVDVRYRARIDGQCRNWVRRNVELEDLRQEALAQLWTALRRDRRVPIQEPVKWISKITWQACEHYSVKARAAKRQPAETPVRIDLLEHPDTIHWPSWYLGADPCTVVVARDSLKRAWRALTDTRREAVNAWLRGEQLERAAASMLTHARRQANEILDSPDGVAPGCSSRRRCVGCDEFLPPGKTAAAKWCSEDCRDRARRQDPEHQAYMREYSRHWKAERSMDPEYRAHRAALERQRRERLAAAA